MIAILDIDGTLVDTNYHHALAWYRAFRQNDHVVPIWRIHRHIGMGGDKLVEAICGAAVEDEQGDDIRAAEKPLYMAMIEEVEPLDGARGLIEDLKRAGHAVVLASSAKEDELKTSANLVKDEPKSNGERQRNVRELNRLADTVERPTVARSVTEAGTVTVTGARSVWVTVASAGARAVTQTLAAPWFGVLGIDVLFEEPPPFSRAMAPPATASRAISTSANGGRRRMADIVEGTARQAAPSVTSSAPSVADGAVHRRLPSALASTPWHSAGSRSCRLCCRGNCPKQ